MSRMVNILYICSKYTIVTANLLHVYIVDTGGLSSIFPLIETSACECKCFLLFNRSTRNSGTEAPASCLFVFSCWFFLLLFLFLFVCCFFLRGYFLEGVFSFSWGGALGGGEVITFLVTRLIQ